MNNRILDEFNRYNRENNTNLRCSALLIALNQIINKNNLTIQNFCTRTLLSEHPFKTIVSYASESFQFKTLAAIFIAVGLSLEEADNLFHEAGYFLNNSVTHRIVRFSLENHLSIDEADDLLYAKTHQHFYKAKKN